MQWLPVLSFILLLHNNVCKETSVYRVSGIELFDIIRGYTPKDGLQLSKVEGDRGSLPDGIYFEPEDEGLSDPKENKYLYLNGFDKQLKKNLVQQTTEESA